MGSRILLALSFVVYIACLPWEAFCVRELCHEWPAWTILLSGALLVNSSYANIAWLANPVLFAAWWAIFKRKAAAALVLSFAALALAASFLLAGEVVTNEAGFARPITGYRIGYWLWLASMALACLAALLSTRIDLAGWGLRKQRPPRSRQ
jgi:hypothetical protein